MADFIKTMYQLIVATITHTATSSSTFLSPSPDVKFPMLFHTTLLKSCFRKE